MIWKKQPIAKQIATLNSKLTPVEASVTWSDGITAQNYTRLSVFGGVAEFSFSITTNTTASGWNAVGTVPYEYAPRIDLYFMLFDNSSDPLKPIKCYINSNGSILVAGVLSNILVRGSCSWIVKH